MKKATDIIDIFIKAIYGKKKQKYQQEIFYVYDKLMSTELKKKKIFLKDFKLTKLNNEAFYPLLTGQYKKDGIACYKMIKK